MKIRDLKYLLVYLMAFSALLALELYYYLSFISAISAFMLLSIQAIKFASKLQKKALKKLNVSNDLNLKSLGQIGLFSIGFWLGDWYDLLFFIGTTKVLISLLKPMGDLEHDFLEIRKLNIRKYVLVNSNLSWNSLHKIKAVYLSELTRFTDQLMNSLTKYLSTTLLAILPLICLKKLNPLAKLYNN